MLGKLLKYEIKSTYRIFLLLYSSIIILASIGRLFLETRLMDLDTVFLPGTFFFLYFVLIFAIYIVTTIIIIQRFYKNLFCAEGYLSFSLPVKSSSHILSKGLIGLMWHTASIVVIALSILIFAFYPEMGSNFMYSLTYHVLEPTGMSLGNVIFQCLACGLASSISSILSIYLCISIGQLFNKNRVGMAFLAYIVLINIIQFISLITTTIASRNIPTGYGFIATYLSGPLLALTVLSAVLSVIYFFASKYILKNKLNLL